MRCLTKPLTAAMAIAVILVSGTAWAGVHGPQEVTISGYPRRAEGTLLGARSSPNTFQFIGCRVFAYPTGSRWTFCQADSGWSKLSCWSRDDSIAQVALSISDYDSVRFYVASDGTCSRLSVGSWSDNIP